jgi:hypothetical protein
MLRWVFHAFDKRWKSRDEPEVRARRKLNEKETQPRTNIASKSFLPQATTSPLAKFFEAYRHEQEPTGYGNFLRGTTALVDTHGSNDRI